MAIVKVDVRTLRQVINTYQCEVPDGLSDEELRKHVEEAYHEGDLFEVVDVPD